MALRRSFVVASFPVGLRPLMCIRGCIEWRLCRSHYHMGPKFMSAVAIHLNCKINCPPPINPLHAPILDSVSIEPFTSVFLQ